jgi:hypothetical protein
MSTKNLKIQLKAIDFSDSNLQAEREDLTLIARAISRSALAVLLDLHPISVAELPEGCYRIVTGDAQLRIARGTLAADDSIAVKCVIGGPEVEAFYTDVDQIISPFALAKTLEQIDAALKSAASAGRTTRLGRDFERPEMQRAMLAQLKRLARKPKVPKGDGSPGNAE